MGGVVGGDVKVDTIQRDTIRSGLGQKFAGLSWIVFVVVSVFRPESRVGILTRRGLSRTVEHVADDRCPVDAVHKGLADALVFPQVVLIVVVEHVCDKRRAGEDLVVGVAFEAACHIGADVSEVDVTALQCQNCGCLVNEVPVDQLIQLRCAVPVQFIGRECHELVLFIGVELERAGADRAVEPPIAAEDLGRREIDSMLGQGVESAH